MNLLEETVEELKENGKSEKDVLFVTDGNAWSSWEDFKKNANFDYDNGYGGQEINLDLKVVGNDWWLDRHEYDGSEWWEYKTLPAKPKKKALPQIRFDWTAT